MSDTPAFRAIAEGGPVHEMEEMNRTIDRLTALAAAGLAPMFDKEKQLFCFTLKQTERGIVRQGASRRYTMMTLMGLRRFEERGGISPVQIAPVLEGLLANLKWIDNIGDLGLLLWLCSIAAPELLSDTEYRLDVEHALARSRHAHQGYTMELAWFLTGLSHAKMACPNKVRDMTAVARDAYHMLIKNQGESGTFGHLANSQMFSGILRGKIGSFADQVYPIYAITKFAQAFNQETALERALDCALAICESQGPLGQWWWHYDSASGRVTGRFPVFSVHQHGMAPMALLALGEAANYDFTPWIYRGLQWIRRNELGLDMEDSSLNVVWRSIYPGTAIRMMRTAGALLGRREDKNSRRGLKVMPECRPYELGWLLYAFAPWRYQRP